MGKKLDRDPNENPSSFVYHLAKKQNYAEQNWLRRDELIVDLIYLTWTERSSCYGVFRTFKKQL